MTDRLTGAGKLLLAIKYEIFDTGNRQRGSFSTNGNQSVNLFSSDALGRNTFKLMLAKVENYGDNIVHPGIDHSISGGRAVAVEIRHNF